VVTRRARGAVFTPESVARHLIEVALDGRDASQSVCDPAAGDGRLLGLVRDRLGPVVRCFGADVCEQVPPGLDASWAVADTLARGKAVWPDAPAEGFDLVIGNPPFRGQLQRETSLSAHERGAVTAELGDVAKGYADTAAMFLVRACEMAAPNGRVAMIMPLSYLAARDAAASRRRVLELATLEGLWVAPGRVFPDADVRVCALILDRGGPRRRAVRRWVGERFDPIDPVEVDNDELARCSTWSHLAAAAFGVPEVHLDGGRHLGELVEVTAGFREQFYGLAPLVVDHPGDGTTPDLAPLVTSGLIDPGAVAWGRRSARIAGVSWQRPAVPLERLEPGSALRRWVEQRLRPKIVIATQTRVVEAAPDPDGRWIPSTPVLAAHVAGDDLWRALAVLLAPPITAWVRARYGGAALSIDAIKLSARQVAELPCPTDTTRWQRAADLLCSAHAGDGIDRRVLIDAGRVMTQAYGCEADITAWWVERLPTP
jgi:hypothetical protein